MFANQEDNVKLIINVNSESYVKLIHLIIHNNTLSSHTPCLRSSKSEAIDTNICTVTIEHCCVDISSKLQLFRYASLLVTPRSQWTLRAITRWRLMVYYSTLPGEQEMTSFRTPMDHNGWISKLQIWFPCSGMFHGLLIQCLTKSYSN